jgi:uncharacterized protein (TIGR03067 family)
LLGALALSLAALFTACPSTPAQTAAERSTPTPTAVELQLLQGTWEGVAAGHESHGKIPITITGNSFHFHRDTNFWFETTIALPAGTDPKQLRATIKGCPPSQTESIGKVVGAIFKIEDGTLTLADYAMSDEPPKTFADATEECPTTQNQMNPFRRRLPVRCAWRRGRQ